MLNRGVHGLWAILGIPYTLIVAMADRSKFEWPQWFLKYVHSIMATVVGFAVGVPLVSYIKGRSIGESSAYIALGVISGAGLMYLGGVVVVLVQWIKGKNSTP